MAIVATENGADEKRMSGRNTALSAVRQPTLWQNRAFTVFWVGDTLSQAGTQVTFVALPMVAMVTLDVGASELGTLRFAEYLPYLLFTLAFGVWADRCRRRPLMVGSYVVRGLAVGIVPLLAALGMLRFPLLVAIAFTVGVGAALFEVCWMSYVPGLVGQQRLVEAMGKVATSHSAAELAGPGLGGLLVQLVKAPYALLIDALSYVVGAVALLSVRWREPAPRRAEGTPTQLVRELVVGLRFALTEPHILAIALSATMGNFFAVLTETAFLVHAVRELRLGPALTGLTLTALGLGGLVGAMLANTIVRRWPLGRVWIGARVVGGAGAVLLPLAAGPAGLVVAVSMVSFFVVQAALANLNVLSGSLRQAVTPEHLRGRMNASVRTLVFGALPLGGLAGGLLTDTLGTKPTLWLGAIGYAAGIIPILCSPIPRLRSMPVSRASETAT